MLKLIANSVVASVDNAAKLRAARAANSNVTICYHESYI